MSSVGSFFYITLAIDSIVEYTHYRFIYNINTNKYTQAYWS